MSVKRKLRAYVAGPISKGDLCANVNQATAAFLALAKAGCAPMCPHWAVYAKPAYRSGPCLDLVVCEATAEGGTELTHADWLGIDLAWVDVCDFLVRLPGESAGADAEVARAYERGIPVFFNLNSALLYAEAASATFLNVKAGAA